jgi:hypothetical protein
MNMNTNRITFVAGLLVALVAGGLLLLDVIESGPAAAFGILGIGLIAASARARRARS